MSSVGSSIRQTWIDVCAHRDIFPFLFASFRGEYFSRCHSDEIGLMAIGMRVPLDLTSIHTAVKPWRYRRMSPGGAQTSPTLRTAITLAFVFGFRLIMLLCAGIAGGD